MRSVNIGQPVKLSPPTRPIVGPRRSVGDSDPVLLPHAWRDDASPRTAQDLEHRGHRIRIERRVGIEDEDRRRVR